jgi:hypothetical protein
LMDATSKVCAKAAEADKIRSAKQTCTSRMRKPSLLQIDG